MKRFVSAIVLCVSLLAGLSFWLIETAAAKNDAILTLLNLPAPPPVNPLVEMPSGRRPPEFYDKTKPPADNAPIDELMDYWAKMSSGYQELGYNPKPSPAAAGRMINELSADPERLVDYLNVLQNEPGAAALVRNRYRSILAGDLGDASGNRTVLRRWLTFNTPEFSADLERVARTVRDANEYVTSQEELLALTRVDWDRAESIVDRLYRDRSNKVSQVLATWALYRRSMISGGSDVDKYRDELKAIVENREATDGMRDLALDALLKEDEWSGRDDWYLSLLEDETLADLRVGGRSYTGLTTIVYYTADDRLTDRFIALMESDNIRVRSAAAKNLLLRLSRMGDSNSELRRAIVVSMLPWLGNRKWLNVESSQRAELVRALQSVAIPEAVPALIEALDEKESMNTAVYASNVALANTSVVNSSREEYDAAIRQASNAAANAMNAAANAANFAATSAGRQYYPLRSAAVAALANQKDARAVPALRRVLIESEEWERTSAVRALIECGGFTTEEKVAALEFMARSAGDVDAEAPPGTDADSYGSTPKDKARMAMRTAIAGQSSSIAPAKRETSEADISLEDYSPPKRVSDERTYQDRYELEGGSEDRAAPLTAEELKYLIATHLLTIDDPDESLVRSMVDRIARLDTREPAVSQAMRKIVIGWKGRAVNTMIMGDIRAGRLDADAILKLLAIRKELREKQAADVSDMAAGVPAAAAISACILEDRFLYGRILNGAGDDAKIALYACARLIRAELPVDKAAAHLGSPNRILATAAERFLESEDSPAARAAILAIHPNTARILGATTLFRVQGLDTIPGTFLRDVFSSVNPYFGSEEYAYLTFDDQAGLDGIERRLQKEVLEDGSLLGIYFFDRNFIRIYADKAVFSWEDDPARYRERVLEPRQFESLKLYLGNSGVDQLPPFLSCTSSCEATELLMIGRAGGRRIFLKHDKKLPAFFAGLRSYFEDMKQQPAQLKYYAAKQVPGLEVVFEDKKLSAVSVWKNGADLRVLVNDVPREGAIIAEVEDRRDADIARIEAEGGSFDGHYEKFDQIREARRFESYRWLQIAGGPLAAPAPQPAFAEYIPVLDGISPPASFGQWAAKSRGVEFRADQSGIYKVTGGRSVRIKAGNYLAPVATSNGRWLVATKYDAEGARIVRIDLTTNRELKIAENDLPLDKAICYILARNLVLLSGYNEGEHEQETEEGSHPSTLDDGQGYFLLDPDTGSVYAALGEVRPLAQQTFRSLQSTADPAEFWAAIPAGKAGTLLGIYNSRSMRFTTLMKLPMIIFDSMEMWVDETAKKAYFIHEGHLLSAPFERPARPSVRRTRD